MTDQISIFIINYNGENVLLETIQSLKNQDYPYKTIILLDDGSTDNSISIVQRNSPDIEIIGLSYNSGFPNKLRRMAIEIAKTRYILLIDNDVVLRKDCLNNLIKAIKSNPDIGICAPRLMYYNDREKIYICWTKFHYLCTSISPLRDTYTPPESLPIDTIGGGTMLIDKEKIDKIGTINDSYPMGWGEDAEIYARMKIAGYKTIYVPDAVGYHHAKEFVFERKPHVFGQARNRWYMILSMYQIKTIICILPALIFYELITILMLIPKKLVRPYIDGILQIPKNFKDIRNRRKNIQKIRNVKDKLILCSGSIYVPQAYLSNPLYKFGINYMNKIFSGYWRFIKFML